jgi:hypothetical protein
MSTRIVVLIVRTPLAAGGAPLDVFLVAREVAGAAIGVEDSFFAALRAAALAPLRSAVAARASGFAVAVGRAGARLLALARAFRSACRAAFLAAFFAAFAARASFSLLLNFPFLPLGSREIGGATIAAPFVSIETEPPAIAVAPAGFAALDALPERAGAR